MSLLMRWVLWWAISCPASEGSLIQLWICPSVILGLFMVSGQLMVLWGGSVFIVYSPSRYPTHQICQGILIWPVPDSWDFVWLVVSLLFYCLVVSDLSRMPLCLSRLFVLLGRMSPSLVFWTSVTLSALVHLYSPRGKRHWEICFCVSLWGDICLLILLQYPQMQIDILEFFLVAHSVVFWIPPVIGGCLWLQYHLWHLPPPVLSCFPHWVLHMPLLRY